MKRSLTSGDCLMSDFKLRTPVAFIIFNRPDTTERVFAEIARARPPQLLVVGDGPRANRQGEAERVAAARSVIRRVDWDCEVLTNLSDINLGCKKRLSSGIDWVFDQVEEAIILEDDCLPDPTFFRFCQEMLERYRTDQRIGMISGDNFQFGQRYGADSYYFSKYVHLWGWATWRNRWTGSYDVTLAKWPSIRDEGRLVDLVGDPHGAGYWGDVFESVYRGEIDAWDYQWVFANWVARRVNVMPSENLVSNIGFDQDATHTKGASNLANLPVVAIKFPLVHPSAVVRNLKADRFSEKIWFRLPLWKRIRTRLAGLLR